MEVTYKCPNCGWETMGIIKNRCGTECICQHCLNVGQTVYMFEQKKETIRSIGGGLFTKKVNP